MLLLFGGKGSAGPADFGNLVAWIDPRYDIVHSGDGSPVTAWTDHSANAHAGTIANAPTYRATDWNGLPAVEFNGSSNVIRFDGVAASFSGTDLPLYVVMALQPLSVASAQTFWHFGNASQNPANRRWDLSTTTLERFTVAKRDDALTQVLLASATDSMKSTRGITTLAIPGTTVRLFHNGIQDTSIDGDTFDVAATTLNLFTIGAMAGTVVTQFSNFRMGPMLIYTSLHDVFGAEQWLIAQGYGPPTEIRLDTITASGSWVAPITGEARVELWSAGGGGGAAIGGGGGGAYTRSLIQVVSGTSYSIGIGTGAIDTNGGDTTWETSVAIAKGGSSATNGRTGGAAGAGTGDFKLSGGNGGVGPGNAAGGGSSGDVTSGVNNVGGVHNGATAATAVDGRQRGMGGGATGAVGLAGYRGEAYVSIGRFQSDTAFPSVVGRNGSRDSANVTSRSATLPSNIQAGERLVLLVASDQAPTITVSGWTKVGQISDGANTVTLALFHKIADGADFATVVTSTSDKCSMQAWRIKNGGVPSWSTASGNSANADPPSHSIGASAKALWIAAAALDDDGVPIISAGPSSYDAFITIPAQSSDGASLLTAERYLETSSTDPGSFGTGSEQWVAATVSVPFESAPEPQLTTLVVDTFLANGTWTSPPHAGTAVVRGWGGGSGNVIDTNAGGGGAYAQLNAWAFAPSTGYSVTVGSGGTGAGGSTTLDTSVLVADGGQTNGTGGRASNSTGDVKYDGGDGVVGAGNVAGGAGAGELGPGNATTPGQVTGGLGAAAAANGFLLGAGAGGHATAQRSGARGELRIEYNTPSTPSFPRLRGYAMGRDTAAATSRPAIMPGNIIGGDLLLCLVAVDATSGGASMSGWTELFEVTETGNQITIAAYYKVAVGGDTGTIATVSSRFTSHVTLRIANAGTPVSATASGDSTNADSPNLDAGTTAKRLWISVVGWDMNTPSATSLTAAPTGFGNVITVGTVVSGAPLLALAMRYEEAQQVNPGPWTSATEQWVAATIGIPYWTF